MTTLQTIKRLKEIADYFDSVGNHEEADKMTQLMNKLTEEYNATPQESPKRKPTEQGQILRDIISEKFNLDPINDIEEIDRKLNAFRSNYYKFKTRHPDLTLEDYVRGNYDLRPKTEPKTEQGQILRDIIAERFNLDPINDIEEIKRKLGAFRSNYFVFKKKYPDISIEDFVRGNYVRKPRPSTKQPTEQGQLLRDIVAEKFNLDPVNDIEEIKRKIANFRANYIFMKTKYPDLTLEDYIRNSSGIRRPRKPKVERVKLRKKMTEEGRRLREIIADRFNLDPINDIEEIDRKLDSFRANYFKVKTRHENLSLRDYVRGNFLINNSGINTGMRLTEEGQRLREIIARRYNLDPVSDIEEIKRKLASFRANYPKMKIKYPDLSMEDYVRGNYKRTSTSKYNIKIIRTSNLSENQQNEEPKSKVNEELKNKLIDIIKADEYKDWEIKRALGSLINFVSEPDSRQEYYIDMEDMYPLGRPIPKSQKLMLEMMRITEDYIRRNILSYKEIKDLYFTFLNLEQM